MGYEYVSRVDRELATPERQQRWAHPHVAAVRVQMEPSALQAAGCDSQDFARFCG